jgi:small subunit ribosomal protein S11
MADENSKAENQQAPAQAPGGTEKPAAVAAAGAPPVPGTDAAAGVRRERKSKLAAVPVGFVHIKATFNNTTVAITDARGGVISWSSAGRAGFKGSRKSTAFAATMVAQDTARQAVSRGMREVEVRVQGAGAGRESAIRALQSSGLNVMVIKDVTSIPHNGCRQRKRRRV